MVNKLMSLATLVFVLSVAIVGLFSPTYPLFLFVSGTPWVELFRFALVAAMLLVSFQPVFSNLRLRKMLTRLGIALICIGGFSLLTTQISNALYDYLKPLDLLFLMEAGVIFSLTSLNPATPSVVQREQFRFLLQTKP